MLFDEPGGVERTKTSIDSPHDGLVLLEQLRIAVQLTDGVHVVRGSHRRLHGRGKLTLIADHAAGRIDSRRSETIRSFA